MIDFMKKIIFYLYNPNNFLVRDSKGKVIPDFRRRRHSKSVKLIIDKDGGREPRCLRREVKGRVSVAKVLERKS